MRARVPSLNLYRSRPSNTPPPLPAEPPRAVVNIGPARKYGAAGIMLAEVLVVLWVAKRAGRVLGLGGGGKRKQD